MGRRVFTRESRRPSRVHRGRLEDFNSSTATALRSQMSGFEPTEDEFRRIFRLQKTFDNEFNQAFDASDPNQSAVLL